MSKRLLVPLLLACLLLPTLGAPPADARGTISRVEDEFERAIREVTPATVVCLPWGIDPKLIVGGSSGVIMSRKGLVLSDGDVGIHRDRLPKKDQPSKPVWSDEIEIRLPNLKGKGFRSFKARVIRRNRELDTSLLRMEDPPYGLKHLEVGNSDDLKVGDFTFAMGNSFGLAAEAPPTLTAGIVASLTPGKDARESVYDAIYTSAAVNRGVNGGPLVDIHGHLVGTISSAVGLVMPGVQQDDPRLAYAYLGKVVPVQRLRAHYADLPEAEELFPEDSKRDPKRGASSVLADVFHGTGRRAYRSVVSMEIKRKEQLSLMEPAPGGMVKIPRYLGPVSGVLVSDDGYILTSLYNVANLAAVVTPGLGNRLPPNARVKAGIDGIESIQVHLPDGDSVSAKIVSHHEGLGLVLIKAQLEEGDVSTASTGTKGLVPATPAPQEVMQAGRFTLVVGNPFGAKRLDDPLLTVGVLSKQHIEASDHPWAGQWQTDAGITDANAGGAAVDLRGRLLGITTIWSSTQHGRNSGIGFVIPWDQIEPVLPEMMRGRSFRPPLIGIHWRIEEGRGTTILDKVLEGKAGAKAGLAVGDRIVKVNGKEVATPRDVVQALRDKWAGDTVVFTVRRGDEEIDLEVTLDARE